MKRFFPFVALLAVVAMVGCSGDSPTAKPVPTVVPVSWNVSSLTVSDSDVPLGTPIQVDVEVTKDGSPAPNGTTVEMSAAGPPGAEAFGFVSGASSKDATKLRPNATIVTEGGHATVYFVADYVDPSSSVHADDPVGTYVLQAKASNAVRQTSVNYRASSVSGTLQIFSLDPSRGSYAGGQQVVIQGKGIVAPVEVDFILNGVPFSAEVVNVLESIPDSAPGSIVAITPRFAGTDTSIEQSADLRVIARVGDLARQETDTLFQAFDLLPGLGTIIFGLSPNSGRSSGGEIVNILGQGFSSNAASVSVTFVDNGGTVRVGVVLAVSPDGTQIQVETPRFSTLPLETDEPQDVTVTTADGQARITDGFIVLADEPQPIISGISPTSGPLDGGTLVTIFGEGFQIPMQVKFGNLTALDVNVFNDTSTADNDRITCVTPDYSQQGNVPPVTVDVTVTNLSSGKNNTLGAAFTYGDPLWISGNTPTEGTRGDLVIIYGSGFEDPLTVDLTCTDACGAEFRLEVVSVSGTELVVRMPDSSSDPCETIDAEFLVTLLESGLTTIGGDFRFLGNQPLVLSVSPITLHEVTVPPGVDPDAITITGQHFSPDAFVRVGSYSVPSATVTVNGDTSIDVIDLPSVGDMGVTFSTTSCTTGGGLQGQRQVATAVPVTVTNFPGECSDTLQGAIVIEPSDTNCVVSSGISLSTLTFPPTETPGPSAGQTLTITETTGSSDLVVSLLNLTGRFFFDAGCSSQGQAGFTVPAGTADSSVHVFFCPDTDNGLPYLGTLNVLSNAAGSPTSQSLTGQEAFPILGVNPGSLSFTATNETQSFTISNTGTGDLSWIAVASGTDFAITSATSGTATAGNTTSVNVQYSGGSPSTSTGSVTVTATEPDAQGSPTTVTLSANVP